MLIISLALRACLSDLRGALGVGDVSRPQVLVEQICAITTSTVLVLSVSRDQALSIVWRLNAHIHFLVLAKCLAARHLTACERL